MKKSEQYLDKVAFDFAGRDKGLTTEEAKIYGRFRELEGMIDWINPTSALRKLDELCKEHGIEP